MMHGEIGKLKEQDCWRVSALFEPLRYNLVVDSVIAGHTPGWVYVDDVSAPQSAWMWNRMGTMLLTGNPHNRAFNRALSAILGEEVAPDARRRRIPSLTLHYASDAWKSAADLLLPGARPKRMWRRFYAFDHLRVDWRDELPSNCVIRRIDRQLLQEDRPENVDHVVGWVLSFWRSIEDFVETGFGFGLIEGEAMASWCLTVYATGCDFELGLATVPECRSRGFATLVAAASLEHSVAQGFTPHWHCDEHNVASIRVAEKVGFSDPTRYEVYSVTL
jgi:GNAT superfamily N-acetyltransferase